MLRETRLWLGTLVATWTLVGTSLLFSDATIYDRVWGGLFLITAGLGVSLMSGRNGWRWYWTRGLSAASTASRAAAVLLSSSLTLPTRFVAAAVWMLLATTMLTRWAALVPRIPAPPPLLPTTEEL